MGNTEKLLTAPRHPYTRFLAAAVAMPDPRMRDREKLLLQGEVPSPMNQPFGCRFRTRCPCAKPLCAEADPALGQRR